MTELQDFQRAFLLLGQYAGKPTLLACTEDGQLYMVAIGLDPDGSPTILSTDEYGNLKIMLYADGDTPVIANGYGMLMIEARGMTQAGIHYPLRVDEYGQLIMVPRGAGGNYMDVDSDGYLTTVIKGAYAGELRTVTLDDAGRLSAFVIDSVDAWGNLLKTGNSELAARLGSPVRFDQRGRVQFIETFKNGLARWTITTSGTGAAVALTPTTWNEDGYSCAMTGGSDASRAAIITWVGGPQITGNIGIEFAWSQEASIDAIDVLLDVRDGVSVHYVGLRCDDADNELQYYDDGGDWVAIDTAIPTNTNIYAYNRMKIVADLTAGEYIRALYNDTEHDLSGTAIRSYASAGSPSTTILIRLYSLSGYNQTAYVDSIILTNAEPA
jgi:hypothetical protein